MSPERQRIAIAEACGWKKIPRPDNEMEEAGSAFIRLEWFDPMYLPNYPADLNAMHEAFLTLAFDDQLMFVDHLLSIQHGVDTGYFDKINWADSPQLVNATAAQRAEAFLRTLGLWEDKP